MNNKQLKITNSLLFIFICLLLTVPAFAADPASPPQKASDFPGTPPVGFRGIKWGAEINDMSDMVPAPGPKAGVERDEKTYTRKGDALQIGKADVGAAVYVFYKNKFYLVFIPYKKSANFVKLKEVLEGQYGAAKKTNPRFEQYVWDWPDVAIILSHRPQADEGKITYYYKPLLREKTIDRTIRERQRRMQREYEH